MRTQPTAQQRPKAFHRVDVHFAHAVAIVIAGKLAPSMVDTLMAVAPGLHTGINAVLVCIHTCPWHDGVFDQGLDGLLLHAGQEIDDHLPPALQHPKDRWSFLLQGPTPRFALQSTATSRAALVLHHIRMAFMAGNHLRFIALDFTCQGHRCLFFTIPSRSWVVICCTSLPLSANSCAMCSFDTFSPIKYRHKIHTF